MMIKPHFTSTLVVISCESNSYCVFASQACLRVARARVGSHKNMLSEWQWLTDRIELGELTLEEINSSCVKLTIT